MHFNSKNILYRLITAFKRLNIIIEFTITMLKELF